MKAAAALAVTVLAMLPVLSGATKAERMMAFKDSSWSLK